MIIFSDAIIKQSSLDKQLNKSQNRTKPCSQFQLYLIAEKVAARMELYQDEYGFIDVAKAIGPFTIDAISTAGYILYNTHDTDMCDI